MRRYTELPNEFHRVSFEKSPEPGKVWCLVCRRLIDMGQWAAEQCPGRKEQISGS